MESTPRVLVVDDEANISFLVGSALRLQGCQVETAETGGQALAAAAALDPQVVVLDIQLPDFDGYEVLRRLRAAGSRAAVIFLTARGTTGDRVRGLTSGGDDYVVKPFALEELVARVKVALRRRGDAPEQVYRWQVADLVLDAEVHRVWRGTGEVALSATEFKLLAPAGLPGRTGGSAARRPDHRRPCTAGGRQPVGGGRGRGSGGPAQ